MNPRLASSLAPASDSAAAATLRQGKSLWGEWVHLLWSAWIFVTPLFSGGISGYTWKWVGLTLVSYPVFLALYVLTVLRSRYIAHRYALGMVVLGTVLLPVYPSGISYFIFGCIMLGVSARQSALGYMAQLLLLNAAFAAFAAWLGYPWQALVWIPMVTFIIGIIVMVERSNQVKDAALKLSHEEVRRLAASAERERIGRDLHDLLGHTLSLVALKSDLASRLLQHGLADSQHNAAQHEISEVSRIAREALAQVRSAVSGIRATGMAAELASAKLLLQCDGIDFTYANGDRDLDAKALPRGVETAFALTVREAVTNIQRHAHARRAEIALETDGKEAVLRIVDDGRGSAMVPGNGLGGMRERIESMGGRLQVDSSKAHGTRIEARLPLAANDDAIPADVMPAGVLPAPDA